jgi:hypothetical protein
MSIGSSYPSRRGQGHSGVKDAELLSVPLRLPVCAGIAAGLRTRDCRRLEPLQHIAITGGA